MASAPVGSEGFTVISEGKAPIVDIVLVHGLQGHPRNTWMYPGPEHPTGRAILGFLRVQSRKLASKKTHGILETSPSETANQVDSPGCFWPTDLLASDFQESRVLTYGYDSHISHFLGGAANQNNLFGHSRNMLVSLEARRRDCPGRPIIYIAHSFGGIIVKDILRLSKYADHKEHLKDIYNSTSAIIFLGTPHRGSGFADWGQFARSFASAVGFDTNSRILRDLQVDSGKLELVREEFSKMMAEKRFAVNTFQEGQNIAALKRKVVDDTSSSLDYAQEIKQTINANHMDMCRFFGPQDPGYLLLKDAVSRLVCNLQISYTKDQRHKITKMEEEFLDTLGFASYVDRNEAIVLGTSETCQWIMLQESFQRWISSETSQILLLSGKPGSGKSVLAKYIQKQLSGTPSRAQDPSLTIYFYFNDRGEKNEKTEMGLIRALLHQIFLARPALLGELSLIDWYSKSKASRVSGSFEWPPSVLRDMILSLRDSKTDLVIYLVIDALDESLYRTPKNDEGDEVSADTASEVIDLLQDLLKETGSIKFKILITSRPATFLRLLERLKYPHISLESTAENIQICNAIGKYTSNQIVRYLPTLDACQLDTLTDVLIKRSEGVFLWIILTMEKLKIKYHHGEGYEELQHFLKEMPLGMTRLYKSILSAWQDQTYQGIRQNILQWVLFSERPLTMAELRVAVGLSYTSNDSKVVARFAKFVGVTCGGLLEIKGVAQGKTLSDWESMFDVPNESLAVVQLVHQSAKDFLLKNHTDWFFTPTLDRTFFEASHSMLATYLIRYLSQETFQDSFILAESLEHWNSRYPLLEYASFYAFQHLFYTKAINPTLISTLDEFLRSKQLLTWIEGPFVFQRFTMGHFMVMQNELRDWLIYVENDQLQERMLRVVNAGPKVLLNQIIERVPDAKDRLYRISSLAAFLEEEQTNLALAVELYRELLSFSGQRYGQNSLAVQVVNHNLANIKGMQHEIDEGLVLATTALEARKEQLGNFHPSTAATAHTVFTLLVMGGRLSEAQEIGEQLLKWSESFSGMMSPSKAGVLNTTAALLMIQNKLPEAIDTQKLALQNWSASLGERHPDCLLSLNNLGILYKRNGDLAMAKTFLNKALDLRKKILGDSHSKTLATKNRLEELSRKRTPLPNDDYIWREYEMWYERSSLREYWKK